MKIIASFIEILTRKMALYGFGAASCFGGYQMKEPKNIFEK